MLSSLHQHCSVSTLHPLAYYGSNHFDKHGRASAAGIQLALQNSVISLPLLADPRTTQLYKTSPNMPDASLYVHDITSLRTTPSTQLHSPIPLSQSLFT